MKDLLIEASDASVLKIDGEAVGSAEEFRRALSNGERDEFEHSKLGSASVDVGDSRVRTLVDHLRKRLGRFVEAETDRIGHSFQVVGDRDSLTTITSDYHESCSAISTVTSLAKGLVRAGAILGPCRAADLMEQLIQGEPQRQRLCVMLDRIHACGIAVPSEAVRLYRLPTSSDLLPASMAGPVREPLESVLGRTVLELDAYVRLPFFLPRETDDARPSTSATSVLGDATLEEFLYCLSLTCGTQAKLARAWIDVGDIAAFGAMQRGTTSMGPGFSENRLGSGITFQIFPKAVARLRPSEMPPPNISEDDLRRAWLLKDEMHRRFNADRRFSTAVTRWSKAAIPGDAGPDRVIELRIALEALFLDSNRDELAFRLATTGARYLATELEERKAVRKTLVDFYGMASSVIHGDEPSSSKRSRLADEATVLCGRGILKMLERQERPIWGDFLLG